MIAMKRRDFLGAAAAGMVLGLSGHGPAWAVDADTARALVQGTLDELSALARSGASVEEKAAMLQSIIERNAAVEQVARFAAGPSWRSMSADQQARYTEAFVGYFSRIYSRRFDGYAEPTVTIDSVLDAGSKGMLVRSRFIRPDGPPVSFEWLVTDRTGEPRIADIVVEGVSTAITQRNEISGLINSIGDIDKVIERLASL